MRRPWEGDSPVFGSLYPLILGLSRVLHSAQFGVGIKCVRLLYSPDDQDVLTHVHSTALAPLDQDYSNVYPSFLLDLSCSVLVPGSRLFCVS